MKKLSMARFAMATSIVLVCGLVPVCAVGYAFQDTEGHNSFGNVAFAESIQSKDSTDKTSDKGNATDKASKSSKDSATSKAKSTQDSKDSKDTEANKATKDTKKDSKAAVSEGDFKFTEDADCAVCHTKEGESLTDETMPASNHEALECTTCHADIEDLEKAHDGVNYGDKTAKRLKQTSIDAESCETCHGSLEELAEKTAQCSVLTDKNGTVVNPHALPENEDHESIDCGSCHSMHKDKAIEDTAKKACKGCHHTDVYECNTCHD